MIKKSHEHTYLSTTNENDGLTCNIGHGECRSHLVKKKSVEEKRAQEKLKEEIHLIIHRVPFRHQHPINTTSLTYNTRNRRKITQRTIKFGQLVDSLVAYKRLANKNDLVRVVRCNQLIRKRGGKHERKNVDTQERGLGLFLTLARARINGFFVLRTRYRIEKKIKIVDLLRYPAFDQPCR